MKTSMLPIATLLCLATATATLADAPTTRPTPVRIVTVEAEARTPFPVGDPSSEKRADLSTYEAALADAKDRASRAAKVLGVTLGPPITVETILSSATDPTAKEKQTVYITSVKIVFELRE